MKTEEEKLFVLNFRQTSFKHNEKINASLCYLRTAIFYFVANIYLG
jgi:hypothetical protein